MRLARATLNILVAVALALRMMVVSGSLPGVACEAAAATHKQDTVHGHVGGPVRSAIGAASGYAGCAHCSHDRCTMHSSCVSVSLFVERGQVPDRLPSHMVAYLTHRAPLRSSALSPPTPPPLSTS